MFVSRESLHYILMIFYPIFDINAQEEKIPGLVLKNKEDLKTDLRVFTGPLYSAQEVSTVCMKCDTRGQTAKLLEESAYQIYNLYQPFQSPSWYVIPFQSSKQLKEMHLVQIGKK